MKNTIMLVSIACLIVWIVEFLGYHAGGVVHIFLVVSIVGMLSAFLMSMPGVKRIF
ncbi:MAG TPA: lmo0937 family membrane protein [Cyclobacteriaceae bacterium]|nr:lmo0937 family membrane protein [Cyclobacteriaceae bacterium]